MLRRNPVVHLLFATALAASVLSVRELRAGESEAERDEQLPGLPFFGEVKEVGSLKSIEGVMVKAEMGARRILVRTDVEGRYKLRPNFGSDVASDSISVSCAKDGYQTVDVSRRRMSSAADAPVEVDCLLAPK